VEELPEELLAGPIDDLEKDAGTRLRDGPDDDIPRTERLTGFDQRTGSDLKEKTTRRTRGSAGSLIHPPAIVHQRTHDPPTPPRKSVVVKSLESM